jgi:hypothetical protein
MDRGSSDESSADSQEHLPPGPAEMAKAVREC